MRRREFIAMAGGAALGLKGWAPAIAQSRPPMVGWLKIQSQSDAPGWMREFRAGLQALGHAEGRTYVLEERHANGDASHLGALAEDLVRSGVSVIVATSQPATEAARRVTQAIPIVARMTDDPVRGGLARSLSRPGANVTGIYSLIEETSAKRLALLREAVPSLRRVGALATLDRGATRHWLAESETAAKQMGLTLHTMDVRNRADLARVFAEAAERRVDGLLSFRNPTVVTYARDVVALASRYRMPSVFESREYVEIGGFMCYGPGLNAIFRSAARYVDKILKGTRAADLPIERPTRFELAVNLKTAKAIGIEIAPAILLRADEVIE